MPFPYISETKDLDDSLRQNVAGDFVALSNGYTHYELRGDPDAETVVLVHGFSVPNFIWDPTFHALTKAGYRVLRYDLFGRGYSDRPNTTYNLDFFIQQLLDLLNALNITEPINLCGLSMGGPITATFTARFPGRVKKLILVDPAGTRAMQLSQTLKSAFLMGAGELLFWLFGKRILLNSIASDFYEPENIKAFLARYRVQMQYRGFRRALLSTLRSGMLGDFSETYKRVGKTGIPVLLLWGREDKTVPYDQAREAVASIPHARFHTIEEAGHIPHYEKADEVNPILLDFLQN